MTGTLRSAKPTLARILRRAADRLARSEDVRPAPEAPAAPARAVLPEFATARRHEDIEWFHSIDLGDGATTAGVKTKSALEAEFAALGLDRAQLEGRSVLDVGTADGWNALRCEQLGASVTAVDAVYREGLRWMRSRLHPRFRFVQMDVGAASFLELGQFDVVLYLGVLYHTAYPYEQLVRVAGRCRDTLLLESACLNLPGAEREPTLTFNFDGHVTPDLSSPVFPSTEWLRQALARVGFRHVEVLKGGDARLGRVLVRARDRDPEVTPLLLAAEQTLV